MKMRTPSRIVVTESCRFPILWTSLTYCHSRARKSFQPSSKAKTGLNSAKATTFEGALNIIARMKKAAAILGECGGIIILLTIYASDRRGQRKAAYGGPNRCRYSVELRNALTS